jgi:hypothetical protein
VSWGGTGGRADAAGHESTPAGSGAPGELRHERWPLRSQYDPSGRYSRRDGSPARVALFHKFDPFTSNCIGAGNIFPYSGLQLLWLVNSLIVLVSCSVRWLHTADVSLTSLLWGVLMLAAVPYAMVATGRVLDLWACLSGNLTAYERRYARRIMYMRGAGGSATQPFRRPFLSENVLEALAIPGGQRVDWQKQHVYAVAELPSHPLRPILVAKMRELRRRLTAPTSDPSSLSDMERVALALSAMELPETLLDAEPDDPASTSVHVCSGTASHSGPLVERPPTHRTGDSEALLSAPSGGATGAK